ncbi:MAG: hypothetical protein ACP6IP_10685 [Candidatus Njordarchaeia archaeon]
MSTFWTFWAITGIDYSGKTTILKILQKKGIPSLHWSDLRSIPWIEPVLEKPYEIVEKMGSLSRAAYILLVASTMFEVMQKNKIRLVDSYWYRFYIKERLFDVSDINILNTLFKLPNPIEVFYIEIDPEIAFERSKGMFTSYESFGPKKEDFISFQTLLDAELKSLLRVLGLNVIHLDGELGAEKLADFIYDRITRKLAVSTK